MKSIKRILSAILMLVMVFTLVVGTMSVSAAADVICTTSALVVDDDFAGRTAGTTASATVGGVKYTGVIGKTAFAKLTDAVKAADDSAEIYVAAGIYTGDIALQKNVKLYGNKADVSPNQENVKDKSGNRDVTGIGESVLHNTVIRYREISYGSQSNDGSLTLNGFAVTGDSALYLRGQRLSGSEIYVGYNIFDLVNDTAYQRIGEDDEIFYALKLGQASEYTCRAESGTFENNRIVKVGSAGQGIVNTGGMSISWVESFYFLNNYIGNVTKDLFSFSQPTNIVNVIGNYFQNGENVRVYDGITGKIDISENTFDAVGGANAGGQYALGVYADATSSLYNNTWQDTAESVLIHDNTFINVGKAIRLYGRMREDDDWWEYAPLGTEIYNNVFTPFNPADCCFLSFGYSDGSYAPKVYDNYTAGLNPKSITEMDGCLSGASIDFGSYWLNSEMTDSSDLLAVNRITNENGISFSTAKIQKSPYCEISVTIPEAAKELTLGLELEEGAYYELFADKACTVPLKENTVSGLTIGINYVYAKVHYLDYSEVYSIMLVQKKFYSTYLGAHECVVGPEFAQYASGQTIYVEIGGEWYRAVVGLSAYSDLSIAIANASIGDIINVTAGVYNSSMTFSKGITIKGAKAGVNPNNMEEGELRPERSNLTEETVFTKTLTLAKGCNGFVMDGCTLNEQAYFYRPSAFKISGMEYRNLVFKGTNTDSAFRSTGNGSNGGTLNDFYFKNCYITRGGSSYTMRWSNPGNAGIEGCIFYDCNKQIYIWGTDGGATATTYFRNNLFKDCSVGTLFNCATDSKSKWNTRLLFENNTIMNCTGGTVFSANYLYSGCNVTIRNNKFIGSSAGGFTVNPKSGTSGQSIDMNNNVFGSSITTALKNNTSCVANATHNYYAKGVGGNMIVGNAVYIPYYTDEALTKLAGNFDVESVISPLGAKLNKETKTIAVDLAAAQDTLQLELKVSEGASYKLYKDSKATEEITGSTVTLNGARTVLYAKITAEDGVNTTLYTVIITQPVNHKAELLGIDVEGTTFLGIKKGVYTYALPNSYVCGPIVPITSAGTTVSVYEGSDTELTEPINYNREIDIPVGVSDYIIKITSEDGKTTNVFPFSVQRQKSAACELLAITGGETPSEPDGDAMTVAYPYTTTAVTPELTVSKGATYELFTDVGGNLRLREDLPLSIGENICYARVTAEDETTTAYYKLILVRSDKSDAKFILAGTYKSFYSVMDEEEDEEGEEIVYLGTRAISNTSYNSEYSLPYIYLTPYGFLPEIDTDIEVSPGATFDIFKNYDTGTKEVSGLISSMTNPKKLPLVESKNDFFVRVTAENNSTQIYLLRVNNLIKSFDNAFIDVNDFTVQRRGEYEYSAVAATDRPQVDIFVSPNATVKVYADRKHTKLIPSTMKTYVVTATKEEFNDCLLSSPPAQSFVKYYLEITSQAGTKQNYILSLTTGTHAEVFTDVPANHWAAEYISDAYLLGITSGSRQTNGTYKFNPGNTATREEVAIFACNLLGVDVSAYSKSALPYQDAKKISSWAKNAVRATTEIGFMTGSNGKFNPKANISRQEFMTVMVRACALDTSKGKTSLLSSFKDAGKVASWAKTYVATSVYYKLVNGNGGYLYPNNSITRAEIVKIMVCAKDFVR